MSIKQDFIPAGRNNRLGHNLVPKYITVHNTANDKVGANAEMHSRYVKNPTLQAGILRLMIKILFIITYQPMKTVGMMEINRQKRVCATLFSFLHIRFHGDFLSRNMICQAIAEAFHSWRKIF